MKVLKGILITLLVLVVLVAVFFGFYCLSKHCGWIPKFTEPLTEFFEKIGITFVKNI